VLKIEKNAKVYQPKSLLTYDIEVKKYFETRSSSGFLIVNNECLKNEHWKAYIKIVTRFISGKGNRNRINIYPWKAFMLLGYSHSGGQSVSYAVQDS
jgi:hypothetical protein